MRGLRIAWSEDFGYASVDSEVRKLTRQAAGRFCDFGCHVEAVDPGWDNPQEVFARDYHAHIAWKMKPGYDQQPDSFEPSLAFMIEAGCQVPAEEILLGGFFSYQLLSPDSTVFPALRPVTDTPDAGRGLVSRTGLSLGRPVADVIGDAPHDSKWRRKIFKSNRKEKYQ